MTPFERGFLKQASLHGVSEQDAYSLCKLAIPHAGDPKGMLEGGYHAGLAGLEGGYHAGLAGLAGLVGAGLPMGLLGAGIGAGVGAIKASNKPEQERRYAEEMLRNALIGGGIGFATPGVLGAAGGVLGAAGGMLAGGIGGNLANSNNDPELLAKLNALLAEQKAKDEGKRGLPPAAVPWVAPAPMPTMPPIMK